MLKLTIVRSFLLALAAALVAVPSPIHADFAAFRAASRIVSLFTLPGEPVSFDLAGYAGITPEASARYVVEASDQVTVLPDGPGRYRLLPGDEVGIHPVVFRKQVPAGSLAPRPYHVQVVIMRPAGQVIGGNLNGYRLGRYPSEEAGLRWQYQKPRGFVEITAENTHVLLSDHVKLGDLDCKFEAPYPHYAAVHTSLLVKLESLVEELNRRGLGGDHLRIMSGYRTPLYNSSIGNQTRFSRHLVGDAADVYVDRDRDDRMDDMNGDGRTDYRDALCLYRIVDDMDASSGYGPLVGGASAYRPTEAHGPFVHLDTRGYPARW